MLDQMQGAPALSGSCLPLSGTETPRTRDQRPKNGNDRRRGDEHGSPPTTRPSHEQERDGKDQREQTRADSREVDDPALRAAASATVVAVGAVGAETKRPHEDPHGLSCGEADEEWDHPPALLSEPVRRWRRRRRDALGHPEQIARPPTSAPARIGRSALWEGRLAVLRDFLKNRTHPRSLSWQQSSTVTLFST